jgi:hypothetical protein
MNSAPDMSRIPGGCVSQEVFPELSGNPGAALLRALDHKIYVRDLLTPASCQLLRAYFERQGSFAPVTIQGMAPGGPVTAATSELGSQRITCWDPGFGEALWPLIKPFLPARRLMGAYSATDWFDADAEGKGPHGHRYWAPVGVSPMARYMRYDQGGQHFTHYDAGYIYPGGLQRTLMSGVLYLTTNSTGATRFIADGQNLVPVAMRRHQDWDHEVSDPELVRDAYTPQMGSVLLFDHRLAHDVSKYEGGEGPRIIIRFDVIFEAIAPFSK